MYRWVALVVSTSVVVGACSSDDNGPSFSKDPLRAAAEATAKQHGTISGTVTSAAGKSTTFTGTWQGNLAKGRGRVRGALPGTPNPFALDARWLGGQMYVKRVAGAESFGGSPLGQLLAMHAGAAIWAYGASTALTARVIAPFSPSDLALALAMNGKATSKPGPRIDGASTTRVTVVGAEGLLYNWTGSKRAEVDIDSADHVRHATIQYGTERFELDVQYGGAAPLVSAPPASELATKAPAGAQPTGPYLTVRTGTTAGAQWTLSRAPGGQQTQCWRWSSTPAMPVVKPNYSTDTRCVPAVATDADPEDRIQFVLWTDGSKSSAAATVAVMPTAVTQVQLGFVGNTTTQPATVTDGLLTWVGSSNSPLAYVGLTIDGTPVACGVGAVTEPGDLTNEQLVGNPYGSAWLCQS